MNTKDEQTNENVCPKCGSDLTEVQTTPNGKRFKRCSKGTWNPKTRKTEGCEYVKWLPFEPQELDEKCPKCGSNLVLDMTRFGKKMKKCSTGGWDAKEKKPTGCDYIEWLSGTKVELDEKCPTCGEKLVLFTTSKGKKMKKCSTNGWDPKTRKPTGCPYVQWLKADEDTGEEFLPPEPDGSE